MDIAKRNIKVRGRWALVRSNHDGDGWDDEVDCYDLFSGSIYAEPWDCIRYKDSPFISYNNERTEIALAKIEQGYEEETDEDDWEEEETYLTIEPDEDAYGIEYYVYEWGTYERGSVLAGQTRKTLLDAFLTVSEAQKAYPEADVSEYPLSHPENSVDHLPDDDNLIVTACDLW
jgi:hypothetical protein